MVVKNWLCMSRHPLDFISTCQGHKHVLYARDDEASQNLQIDFINTLVDPH